MDSAASYIREGATLRDALQRALAVYDHREFTHEVTYPQLRRTLALWALGIEAAAKGDMIAIMGLNNVNWVYADMAAVLARCAPLGPLP
jgi:long-subunit acyl-CoA synthetase (AMP-forming)